MGPLTGTDHIMDTYGGKYYREKPCIVFPQEIYNQYINHVVKELIEYDIGPVFFGKYCKAILSGERENSFHADEH